MIKLNLKTENHEHEKIKAYLEQNASETLAEKINNGVKIVKDGKTLLNKKDLVGFMDFANAEAKKLAAKGTKGVCIDDDTVYGWAIHYFEEESIEGTLYNADGTEYKPKAPVKAAATVKKPEPVKTPKPQLSIFDMGNETAESAEIPDEADEHELADNADEADDETDDTELDEETENDDFTPEEINEVYGNEAEQIPEPVTEIKQFYQCYLNLKEYYKDCIIAYRLGDFFEIFGKDAETIASELNLTLTGRDVGLKERVPMVGVPYHRIDEYVPKIISKGHKIAVTEPIGETVIYGGEEKANPQPETTVYSPAQSEEDILTNEREIAKAFDANALIILSDLLGEIFIME